MNTDNLKILAIIPARGGSKSIPHKNIVNVAGKPLICWTIQSSIGSKYINKTVVTSDDIDILNISKKCGASTLLRPKKYSNDKSDMIPVIEHCIKSLEKKNKLFDVIILLQPTSPLRNSYDIDVAFRQFFKYKANALISGYEPEKSPYKSFKLNKNGHLEGIIDNKLPFYNRQDLPKTFYPNGAIYIIYNKCFKKYKSLFCPKTIPYWMSIGKSIDIDSKSDIINVSQALAKNYGKNIQNY